jgi:hypothetical protein
VPWAAERSGATTFCRLPSIPNCRPNIPPHPLERQKKGGFADEVPARRETTRRPPLQVGRVRGCFRAPSGPRTRRTYALSYRFRHFDIRTSGLFRISSFVLRAFSAL